jgi:hypothetical protein
LFKETFGINQDTDIIGKDSADLDAVATYNESGQDEDEPNPLELRFDMMGSVDSLWNKRVLQILREKFRALEKEKNWNLPARSNLYIDEMIQKRMERIRGTWRTAQLRIKENGDLETDAEWESRIEEMQLAALKRARHLNRRRNVSDGNENSTPWR